MDDNTKEYACFESFPFHQKLFISFVIASGEAIIFYFE